jgi:hypothetical protein
MSWLSWILPLNIICVCRSLTGPSRATHCINTCAPIPPQWILLCRKMTKPAPLSQLDHPPQKEQDNRTIPLKKNRTYFHPALPNSSNTTQIHFFWWVITKVSTHIFNFISNVSLTQSTHSCSQYQQQESINFEKQRQWQIFLTCWSHNDEFRDHVTFVTLWPKLVSSDTKWVTNLSQLS